MVETISAQSAGVEEYTKCISAEGKNRLPDEFRGYKIKPSDNEAPVMLNIWGMQSTHSLP